MLPNFLNFNLEKLRQSAPPISYVRWVLHIIYKTLFFISRIKQAMNKAIHIMKQIKMYKLIELLLQIIQTVWRQWCQQKLSYNWSVCSSNYLFDHPIIVASKRKIQTMHRWKTWTCDIVTFYKYMSINTMDATFYEVLNENKTVRFPYVP